MPEINRERVVRGKVGFIALLAKMAEKERQRVEIAGQLAPPRATSAAEPALRLRPRRALSSAQPTPQCTTTTALCKGLAANGDDQTKVSDMSPV
jgi:hypothetical protein